MDEVWSVPAWAVLATLAAVVVALVALTVALVRTRVRTRAALETARSEAAALATQVEAIERRLADPAPAAPDRRPARDDTEYVVTMLGRDDAEASAPAVPAPLFADLVLRESAVQAVSLAAGLRRALAPEVRHRIRWEMRREVKRARKQRRADLRQAKREFEERQRAAA
jgi:hypothetical protein